MNKFFKKSCYFLLGTILSLLTIFIFLIASTPGLYLTIKLTNLFLPESIKVSKLNGRLLDNIHFEGLTYGKLHIDKGDFSWKLTDLIHDKAHILANAHCITIQGNKLQNVQVNAILQNSQWHIDTINFIYQAQALDLNGNIASSWPYTTSIKLEVSPQSGAPNKVFGQATLTGDIEKYQWVGDFKGDITASTQGKISNGKTINGEINVQKIKWQSLSNKFHSGSGLLSITGELPSFSIQIKSNITAPFMSQVNIDANYDGSTLRAHAQVQQEKDVIEASLEYANDNIEAHIIQGANHADVTGKFPCPLHAHISIPEPNRLHSNLEKIQTKIQADINLAKAQLGDIHISISPGIVKTDATSLLHFAGGSINGSLNRKEFKITGLIAIDSNETINIAAHLPNFNLDRKDWSEQLIDSQVTLSLFSLSFLEKLSSDLTHASGKLAASLKLVGKFEKPQIKGEINLEKASITMPQYGISLSPINATLNSHHNTWKLKGQINEASENLNIKGEGRFFPKTSGKIAVNGTNFTLINNPEYQIIVTPNLELVFAKNDFDIKGTLAIPKAKIAPISFDDSETLTDDAVFVGKDEQEKPINTQMQVKILLGQDVNINVSGLTGNIDGNIELQQQAYSPLSAIGELSIHNGRYHAYGQDLKIEQGQLIFSGGLITNPGIQIRAIRNFKNTDFSGTNKLLDFSPTNLQPLNFGDNTTVGIEVTGRLRKPQLKLFSVPPTLSQADILSMLLLGKPATQAGNAGGQLLLSAISALNLGTGSKGTQLMSQINQTLGFDIGVDTSTTYNQQTNQTTDQHSISIGKKISNRAYASYRVGLFQEDSNVFTLRYLMNKFFSIQVNASDSASGIDVLYTRHKAKM